MWLDCRIIVFALLICYTPAFQGHVLSNSSLRTHDSLKKLLTTCFAESLSTLVITSDINDIFRRRTWDENPVPVISIDEDFDADQFFFNHKSYPTFLLTATSSESLKTTLHRLKPSSFWNINALFFIVGNCSMASVILQATWAMDLLSAFYLCNEAGDVSLYTFNPFTNRAPAPWQEVETVDLFNGPWTLYRQLYFEGLEFCPNLKFDKTKFLDGYKIKAIANTITGEKWTDNKDYYDVSILTEKLYKFDAMSAINILTAMNVTAIINFDEPGFIRTDGKAVGFLPKLMNGSYDIALSSRGFLTDQVRSTYPFAQGDIAALTAHRDFLEPIEKIVNFYSIGAVSLTAGVLLITWAIFVVIKKGQMTSAALETLRLVLSTGLLQSLEKVSMRIYLFGVLWLIIILNATFQGNISAFLTKPERHDVDSIGDILKYKYHVYVLGHIYHNSITDPKWADMPQDHMHIIDDFDCSQYVNATSACIQSRIRQFHPAATRNLHISKDSLAQPYACYWYRDNWPLAAKYHIYMSRLMQAGLLSKYKDDTLKNPQKKLDTIEDMETAPRIRPIQLNDLVFAFQILATGLTPATILFAFELRGWQDKKNNKISIL